MSLIDSNDSLERQNEKLLTIAEALMKRVEHGSEPSNAAYARFERAALLEQRVRERTLELEHALDLLHQSNAQIADANQQTEAARRNLADAIETVSEGFALFDDSDHLVMCNSRFCRDFSGMRDLLKPSLSFERYVDEISKSKDLSLPAHVSPTDWAAQRYRHHQDQHALFNVALHEDRWLQVSEHRTANGGTVVLQTDVTDLVRLERQERERLRDKQTRMIRATLDHLNQGVCVFDEAARLVGWNEKFGTLLSVPARFLQLGVSFGTLIDQLDKDVVFTRGLDREGFRVWAQEPKMRPPISFEIRHGFQSVLQIFGRGMPDQGFVVSVTDVTTEREAAQKLFEINAILEKRVVERTLELEDALSSAERANATKSRFVAAASHDLLQPLSAAKLFLSTLEGSISDSAQAQILTKTQSALTSAEHIIEALLDISKLDSEDDVGLDVRPVLLRDVLGPLRDEFEILAAQKNVELRFVDSRLWAETDPNYLRRIIQNLLANAVRYTDAGKILLGVRRNGSSARIEVWDTGAGIACEDQSVIFEEFRRLNPRSSANEGLGLGLAIVERACARLGHDLDLWSEIGRGSCFMVNVPVVGPTPEPVDQGFQNDESLSQAGMIVLLVEDDRQLRRALVAMLEAWGVHVIEAENAPDTLELLEELQLTPDALLIDYQLSSGPSGLGLYHAISDRLGKLPCVIISADRSRYLRNDCKELGVDFLPKPLDRHKIRAFLGLVAVQLKNTA